MFELGEIAMLVSAVYAGIGIFMAHTLYKSPRAWWQCLAAWASVLFICTAVGEVLNVLFPQYTEQRLAMFTGCALVLAYLYLFPNIPLAQRIFNYFLAINLMYLLLLFSRTVTMLLVGYFNVNSTTTFALLYFAFAVAYCVVFTTKLRYLFRRSLVAFQKNLNGLTLFSILSYGSALLLVDAWSPWPALTVASALPHFALLALNLAGYGLAFRTLTMVQEHNAREENARRLTEQLALSERYYGSLVEQIEQTRLHNHDLRHHVNALCVLCEEAQWNDVRSYVTALSEDLPRGLSRRYCAVPELNAMLDYYAYKCQQEDLRFTCHVELPADTGVNSLHLCVIFGNALENALEASRTVAAEDRLIDVSAALSEHRVVISVANRFGGILSVDESGLPRSTKLEPGHGLGLASIRETAQRYDGWCGTHSADGMFTLQVLLKCRA